MNSRVDIEKLLERFGGEWPDDGSIVERVVQEMETTPVRKTLGPGGPVPLRKRRGTAEAPGAQSEKWPAWQTVRLPGRKG